MHLAQNNPEHDIRLKERPNSGRRAAKLQTWDKAPTAQLQLIPAENQDKGSVCWEPFIVKSNQPELTGPSTAAASDVTGSPPASQETNSTDN